MNESKSQFIETNIFGGDDYFEESMKRLISRIIDEIPREDQYTYIDWMLGNCENSLQLDKGDSGYQVRTALREMLDNGVSKSSIMDLVRVAQSNILCAIFCVLENIDGLDDNNWGIFILDKKGKPKYKIDDLASSFEGDEFLPRSIKKKLNSENLELANDLKKTIKIQFVFS